MPAVWGQKERFREQAGSQSKRVSAWLPLFPPLMANGSAGLGRGPRGPFVLMFNSR